MAKELGIDDATVRAFRHFFITFALDRDGKPTQVMKWVGHHDLSVILIYYHLSDEESQKAMASILPETSAGQGEEGSEQAQNEDNFDGKHAA